MRRLRRLLVLALLGAAVGAAVRALRARRALLPVSDGGPTWPPLSAAEPAEAAPMAAVPAEAAPAEVGPVIAVEETAVDVVEVPSGGWMAPVDGACPDGYPVKANQSGIYHVPGGQFYDRTVPARCYVDPQAAEADGYRAALR